MARVRLFHWKASEATPLIVALRAAGHTVDYPTDKVLPSLASIKKSAPDAVVIDLTRMPSHGRHLATGLRNAKYARHIPIVFVDGDPEKVAAIRKLLPDAVYTTRAKVGAAVKKAKPVADPVVPTPMMFSYVDRTVAQKLGIRDNTRVALVDAPTGYAKMLGAIPKGAS